MEKRQCTGYAKQRQDKIRGIQEGEQATNDGKHVVISTTTQRHLRDVVELAGGSAQTPDTDADALVAAWILKRPLRDVVDTLVAKRIPIAPVNDLDMLLADPHIQARQSLIRTNVPGLGDMAITAPSPRLSVTPGALRSPGPTLGEHNEEVFGTLLGLSAERRAALAGSGTIGK